MLGRIAGDGDRGDGARAGVEGGEMGQGMAGYVRNPQEGETLAIGSILVTMKATGAETKGRFSLVEVTVPPYYTGIWPHLHQQSTEAIYLTNGMLAVTLGEETMVVRQGSFILIPPKLVHRVWNPAATQATFLAYFSPAGAEGFFEALAAMELVEGKVSTEVAAEVWDAGKRFDHFQE